MTDPTPNTPELKNAARRGRRLLILTMLVALVSVFLTWHRIGITREYLVQYHAPCNIAVESCFVSCEPGTEDCEPEYYVIMEQPARNVYALCGLEVNGCSAAFTCPPGESTCTRMVCTEDTALLEDAPCSGDIEEGASDNEESVSPNVPRDTTISAQAYDETQGSAPMEQRTEDAEISVPSI